MAMSKTEPVTRTKHKEGRSMKVKTRDLTGAALDWTVAKCDGFVLPAMTHSLYDWFKAYVPRYSADWAQGGPIIEREMMEHGMSLSSINHKRGKFAAYYWSDDFGELEGIGPTPLIAAMRCYVASKLGDEVDVPDVLDAD